MAKKSEFEGLYQGIREEMPGIAVAYTRKGNYSVFFRIQNPVEQYCADTDAYYNACYLFESIVKTLGEGYALQKQDIFSRQSFYKDGSNEKFLGKSYMKHFEGREYTDIQSYLIVTQEVKATTFNAFDKKKFDDFWIKIQKVQDILTQQKVSYHILNIPEVTEYLHRFLGVSFRKGRFSFDNFKSMDTHVKMGERAFKMIDMIDIDEVILPAKVKPYNVKDEYPVDLFSFFATTPGADCVIFTQSIIIPNQRKENAKLTANMNRKRNIKDPGNLLAAQDIEDLMNDIAKDNKMLVYTNYTVMIVVKGGEKELQQPFNYIEKNFFDLGIGISKCSYNQLELFICSFPGNELALKDYERFLCPSDAAACFMFKESMKTDEDTPLKIHYADRQGIPIAIDITGKEGKNKLTTNSNFFSLGPSGSGKSFHMNSVVRQLYEQDTDIVMVDTGNSYEGLCSYVNGKYIAYTQENPITMNPFKITEEENNIEKQDFLKSLIFLIWKGSNASISKIEDTLIGSAIEKYFEYYFHPFNKFTDNEKLEMKNQLLLEAKVLGDNFKESKTLRLEREKVQNKIKKLEKLAQQGVGGERSNASMLIDSTLARFGYTRNEIENPDTQIELYIEERIQNREDRLAEIHIADLSFNSFYEFCLQFIPLECEWNEISFDMREFKYAIKQFYKGGTYERILNDDCDTTLFNERFIVFEVDAIKDNPILFPIVTLIIMDVFIQKMRLKKCRKALIIEEAWKAIASPLMANYIKYLYKTVRKFWGIVGVVTQEIDDIISNATLKESIINNSEITILLDQSKFKDRYSEIAKLLGLSEIEQRKIWSINRLDNREGRSFFKEVYIRRGSQGEVYGVEESPECYMAYTTERLEKDALKMYNARYGGYENGITNFCGDWKIVLPHATKADAFSNIVNSAVKVYNQHFKDEHEAEKQMLADWEEYDNKFKGALRKQVFVSEISKNKAVWKNS